MTNLVFFIAFFLFVLKLCNERFLLLDYINSVIPVYRIIRTAHLPHPFPLVYPLHRYSPLRGVGMFYEYE